MATEKQVIDALLDQGMYFDIDRKFTRVFTKKPRRWVIKQPFLGTLDYLTREYLVMDFDENKLQENPLRESKIIASKYTMNMARIVAIALLNGKWKIKLFTGILSRYLFWRLTPSKIVNLAIIINTLNNTTDFTNSIRLMSGMRTTAPKADLIEQKLKG